MDIKRRVLITQHPFATTYKHYRVDSDRIISIRTESFKCSLEGSNQLSPISWCAPNQQRYLPGLRHLQNSSISRQGHQFEANQYAVFHFAQRRVCPLYGQCCDVLGVLHSLLYEFDQHC